MGGELVQVEVEGAAGYLLAEDIEELEDSEPATGVRLLPAFDQYVLGPGTSDSRLIPAGRRREVSKAAGWISPVVLAAGRVTGVWNVADRALSVSLFAEARQVSRDELEQEAARLARYLGRELAVTVETI
jgi:hypothetical protein